MTKWPRGSEWRKWDLHIHAPGTKLNDQFRADGTDVWEEYCKHLVRSDVAAFGITDYFSADTYLRASRELNNRFPNSGKVLFPNVELRTIYVVNSAQEEVHLHVIFNPFRSDHHERIERFLTYLKTTKTDAGGREVRASELKATDVQAATTSLPSIRAALEDTYGEDSFLLDHLLFLASANNDGIRAERGKARKAQIADEVDKFCDAFFGNATNVDYFLGESRAEDPKARTEPKPVVSGSDAHSFAELKERMGQVVSDSIKGIVFQPTWIKADLTFEGLKQIIFEPRNRVYIGREPEVERRVRENPTWYIESLQITSVDGYDQSHGRWFDHEHILLGKELVAIIGNKGSGKSAVTDVIGLVGNSHNQILSPTGGERVFSFLNREKFLKGGCADHFRARLNWHDGPPDERLLSDEVALYLPEKVEYLPQRYLERICANIADDEFRRTLNEVIYGYVPEAERYGKADLDDLINYLTQESDQEIAQKQQELHQANEEVVAIERKLTVDYRERLAKLHKLKKDELEAHGGSKPLEVPAPAPEEATESGEIATLTDQIAGLTERIKGLEAERVRITMIVEELRQLRQGIQSRAAALMDIEGKWRTTLEAIDIPFNRLVNLRIDLHPLEETLASRNRELSELHVLLLPVDESDTENEEQAGSPPASLFGQRSQIERARAALVERLSKPLREYEEYRAALRSWTDQDAALRGDADGKDLETLLGLERELDRIATAYPKALIEARTKRAVRSKEIFGHRRAITTLYDTIKGSIDAEIVKAREDLGAYDISLEAGLRLNPDFVDDFLAFVNQGVTGSFRGQDEGRAMVRRLTETVLDWEVEADVFAFVDAMVEALHHDRRPDASPSNAPRDVFKQMKGQRSVEDLYDYLFSFDYLKAKYDLKVDQKDLSELSPGERGGLLLIFYLMLDRQRTPLVIDQPEDNLDNKSVYEILVKFIRQAKQRRQIILVTHNPNLAVVADAEQIIHVAIDKKDGRHDFDFFSGSIEEPNVNRAVVDILEGTLPAFDNRRLKYRRGELEPGASRSPRG